MVTSYGLQMMSPNQPKRTTKRRFERSGLPERSLQLTYMQLGRHLIDRESPNLNWGGAPEAASIASSATSKCNLDRPLGGRSDLAVIYGSHNGDRLVRTQTESYHRLVLLAEVNTAVKWAGWMKIAGMPLQALEGDAIVTKT